MIEVIVIGAIAIQEVEEIVFNGIREVPVLERSYKEYRFDSPPIVVSVDSYGDDRNVSHVRLSMGAVSINIPDDVINQHDGILDGSIRVARFDDGRCYSFRADYAESPKRLEVDVCDGAIEFIVVSDANDVISFWER